METASNLTLAYVALSSMLCAVLWAPYVGARALLVWGLPTFFNNYPEGFPITSPEQPLWAARSHRAHLNLVETLPAFIGVTWAAITLGESTTAETVATWSAVFFWARLAHAMVYIGGVPFVRTPVYLVSWAAILIIGVQAIG